MTAGTSAELMKLTCWPTEILTEGKNGNVKGFLMPSAGARKEIHLLYSPKSRSVEFASVQWQFLIAAAANMARAFAVVHCHGHVIGDVNHSSVMIAGDATVRLIDCDSFQIRAGGRLFRCEVGEPGHTAPELQGKVLAKIDRSPVHDNFGLAVLIFELLFMGRHPFAGQFTGQGDLGLEEKIAGFRFAYGPGAASRQMKPPPHTLTLDSITPRVATLFEAAFSSSGPSSRPTAADWVDALEELRAQTKQCVVQKGHFYYKGLAQCPWCPIEAKLGLSLFTVQFATVPTNPGFNMVLVWESIQKVPRPITPHPIVPLNAIAPGRPDGAFVASGRDRKRHLAALCASVAATVGVAILNLPLAVLPLIIFLVILSMHISKLDNWTLRRRDAQTRVERAKAEYEQCRSSYQHWTDGHLFGDAFRDLEAKRQTLLGLAQQREKVVAELRNRAESVLRKQFLNGFPLRPGVVNGIGPSRCADLQYYNIDTAADIEFNALLQVPGIGPSRASDLLAWRCQVESRFRFDPQSITKTPEFRRIESDFSQLQSQLESALMGGSKVLRDIAAQTHSQQAILEPKVQKATADLAQAMADLKAL